MTNIENQEQIPKELKNDIRKTKNYLHYLKEKIFYEEESMPLSHPEVNIDDFKSFNKNQYEKFLIPREEIALRYLWQGKPTKNIKKIIEDEAEPKLVNCRSYDSFRKTLERVKRWCRLSLAARMPEEEQTLRKVGQIQNSKISDLLKEAYSSSTSLIEQGIKQMK